MVNEKKELAIDTKGKFNYLPTSWKEALDLASFIAKSELAPSNFRGKPENCIIAMQMGAEVGLSPMQAIQNIAVINGRPSVWGDAMLAIVQAHPAYEWHKETKDEKNGEWAEITIKRKGSLPHTVRFTKEDAKKAGLLGKAGVWQNYPLRMMQMRARSWACRDQFSDALRGLQSAEEITDYVDTTIVTQPQTEDPMPKMTTETPEPKTETKTDTASVFIVKATKLKNKGSNDCFCEILDSEGVVYGADVETGKKAKTFEGKQAVISYEGREGRPWMVDIKEV